MDVKALVYNDHVAPVLAYADAEGNVFALDDGGHEGVWRTIHGRKVFIREGEDLTSALTRSGVVLSGKTKVVDFDKSPWDVTTYKNAPDNRQDIMSVADANKLRSEFKSQGRLNEDGRTVSVFHTTSSDSAKKILALGFIPGAESAPGQAWKAKHSSYATYFHGDARAAWRDAVQSGPREDWTVIEARIPITPKSLIRVLPDEDVSLDRKYGVRALLNTEAIAYIGGVPPNALRLAKFREDHFSAATVNTILAYADAAGHVYVGWDESKHPRNPAGSESGGEFAPSGHAFPTMSLSDLQQYIKARPVSDVRAGFAELDEGHRTRIAARVLGEWDSDSGPGKLRAEAAKLVQLSGEGDVLAHLHPGEGTVYRGGRQFKTGLIASWSFDKEYAKIYGALTEKKLARSDFALSLDKLYRNDQMHEILLGTGSKQKTYSIARPLYVSRHVENADEIIAWAKSVGFETTLPAEDMHVTICYSREPVDWLALEHWADTLEIPPEGVRTLVWDEGAHARGKTTSGSRGGSFSPSASLSAARSIKNDKNEVSILLDQDGKQAARIVGDAERVATQIGDVKGGALIHNHPDDTSFSYKDVVLAGKWARSGSVDQLLVVGPSNLFTIKVTSPWSLHDWNSKILPALERQEKVIAKQINVESGDTLTGGGPVMHRLWQWAGSDGPLRGRIQYSYQRNFEQHIYADRAVTQLGSDGAVVLRFDSKPLQSRHQYFLDHGASWDYDEYRPHITLTYDLPEGLDLNTIESYMGRIVLGPEEFQELEEDWSEDIKEHEFDPNQPRDDHGRWADVIGIAEGKFGVNRPVKEKLRVRQVIGEELDGLANNPAVSKALGDLEKVYVHTHIPRMNEPGGIFSPAGVVRRGIHGSSEGDYFVGNKIYIYPYRPAAQLVTNKAGLVPESASLTLFSGSISADTLRGTLRHEVGHLVHWRALPDGPKNGEWMGVWNKIKDDPDQYVVGGRPGFKTKGWSRVSGYANTNHKEAFAESFTAYTHPEYKKGMLPMEVEGFFDKHIGRGGFSKYSLSQKVTVLFGTPETGWVEANVDEGEVKEHAQATVEIDYAQIKTDLDALEAKFRDELREILTQSRDALMTMVRSDSLDKLALEIKLPYATSIQRTIRDAMQRAIDRGGADARREVNRIKKYTEWDESKHPRDEEGQWTESARSSAISDAVYELNKITERMPEAFGTDSEDFYYHVTNQDRAEEILRGSLRTHGPSFGTDQDAWPDGSIEKRSYWVGRNNVDNVWQFAPEDGKAVLLRVNKTASVFKVEATGDIYSRKAVPAAAISVLTKEGWKSVQAKEHSLHVYAPPTFVPTSALKWLRIKSFWVSGVLNTGLTEDARRAIINGLKTGKPNSAIITDIARAYIPYLGDPTAVEDGELPTAARLETVVRTNITEAYNKGRLDTYIRPDLMPFLDGVEYSAILDSRTTPVCRFLDGKIFKPDDPELHSLTPPNHFNCRSLVVPIMVGDKDWDPSNFITPVEIEEARSLADAKFLEQEDYVWDELKHPRDDQGQFAPSDAELQAERSDYNKEIELLRALPADVKEKFQALANAQRGEPEVAMLKVQMVMGGGVLNPVVEHVGDLTHRMTNDVKYGESGYEYVREKIDKMIRTLDHPYGFEREMSENIKNNAEYGKKYTPGEYASRVNAALDRYAAAHRALPAYNIVQKLARNAAVAVGERRFRDASSLLHRLDIRASTRWEFAQEAAKFEHTTDGGLKLFYDPDQPRALAGFEEEGVWRTIRGRRVFIREGEGLDTALKRSLGGGNDAETKTSISKWSDSQVGTSSWTKLRKDVDGKFAQALSNVSNYSGMVYRGLGLKRGDVDALKKGKVVNFSLHSSASKEEKQARPFALFSAEFGSRVTPVMLEVETKRAADITSLVVKKYRHQKEVVLMKGTKYRVTSVEKYVFPAYRDKGVSIDSWDGLKIKLKQV